MELRPDQLAAQAAAQPLRPVYLVAGPEPLLVLEAADAIRARARAEGAEREVFEAEGRDPDWDGLEAAFNAPSLFSSRRLLELRLPGGKPGKTGAKVIEEFCRQPPGDVTLLIVAGDWSKAHHGKWVDAVSRSGVVSIAWAMKPHELPGWIDRRLRERGLRAAPEAVQGLAERVEGNLLAAAQEIDKLVLLAPDGPLDLEAMQSLVADAARYDVFRLIESTLSGQPAQVQPLQELLHGSSCRYQADHRRGSSPRRYWGRSRLPAGRSGCSSGAPPHRQRSGMPYTAGLPAPVPSAPSTP